VEGDLVECIVALPKQLFYNTGIPACLWFLRREKNSHSKEILFIDATEMGFMKDRVHRDYPLPPNFYESLLRPKCWS
jgi:type I restriction enzyme M protein